MKQISWRLCLIAFFLVVSCKQNSSEPSQENSNAVMETPAVVEASMAEAPEMMDNADAFDPSLDSLSASEKELKIKGSTAEAVDAYCPVCDRRCCRPCFARAGRNCASLKFENCSVCNHSSNGHRAVAH